MIRHSVEVARTPAEVFAYIEQLDRHGEWQEAIVSARKEPPGPTRLGTRNIEVRRVPGGPREFTAEVFEYDPPRRIAARGLNGPIRPTIAMTVEPIRDGAGSRVTLDLDLRGYGIGKILVFVARLASKKKVPADLNRLKTRLESGG